MMINFKSNRINQIYYDGGTLKVDSSASGGITSTVIEQDEKQTSILSAVVDEQVTLYDGKTLKRIRDNLTVE